MNKPHAVALVALMVLSGASTRVEAQPLSPALAATRRDAIESAREAARAGDHERALELALRAGELEATPSLHGLIAREARAVRRWALALGEAQRCVAGAELIPLRERAQWTALCQAVIDEAAPRVARVLVQTPRGLPEGARLIVAGETLPRGAWSLPFVVDPGEVVVEATAPGHDPFWRALRVDAGGRSEVVVTLAARATSMPTAPPVVVPPTARPPQPAPRSRSPFPWIIAGAGVVSLGVSGLLYALSSSEYEAARECVGREGDCAAYGRYRNLVAGTNTTLIVGATLVAAGVGWLVYERVTARPTPRVALLPMAPHGSPGLTVFGSF